MLPTEVYIVRLGTIAIATNPFELFLDYGNQIKACSNAEQTFLIQLSNGAEGYLPTLKAERGGNYSAFRSLGQVVHMGGEQLVCCTLQEINTLFPRGECQGFPGVYHCCSGSVVCLCPEAFPKRCSGGTCQGINQGVLSSAYRDA